MSDPVADRPLTSPSGVYGTMADEKARAVTLRTLYRMAQRNEPFSCLACYDAATARWLERAGVHVLLAGDSAAQVVLGYERTIDAPLDFMIHITAAIKRGAPSRLIMADMPFLSVTVDTAEAIRNAGRFMREGLADVVKVESDGSHVDLVRHMTSAGIPVCAHVGLKPQHVGLKGGYRAEGRTADDARRIIDDAHALEQAGAVLLLVEAVPDEVIAGMLEATSIPIIGIGAGPACHGQILVVNDLIGLTDNPPRFVDPVAALGPAIRDAGAEWVRRVSKRRIGGTRYVMPETEAERLESPSPRPPTPRTPDPDPPDRR